MTDNVQDETQDPQYRAFLAAGEVRMQTCSGCGHVRHPARWLCPECLSTEWRWETMSGAATVETFVWYFESLDPRFRDLPYNVAIVRLDEGPRVITNVLDLTFGALSVGQRVQATITIGPGEKPLLCFNAAPQPAAIKTA